MASTAARIPLATDTSATAEHLLIKLDDLYTAYLNLLHVYTEARARLAESMSDGFFSLAQANFSSQNRMRFGQDQYDERMQASRTVTVEQENEQAYAFRMEDGTLNDNALEAEVEDAAADDAATAKAALSGSADDSSQAKAVSHDPLRWFGILVPQSLRTSQKHFTESVRLIVEEVATHDSQLKALEIEIRRTKKQLTKLKS